MAVSLGTLGSVVATGLAYDPGDAFSVEPLSRSKTRTKGRIVNPVPQRKPSRTSKKPRTAFSFRKGTRSAPASPSRGPQNRLPAEGFRSFPAQDHSCDTGESLGELLDEKAKVAAFSTSKHIPIVVPQYASLKGNHTSGRSWDQVCNAEKRVVSVSHISSEPSKAPKKCGREPPPIASGLSFGISGEKPKYVEIKIPAWAQPILKESIAPPRISLRKSTFVDPFASVPQLSSLNMLRQTPDSSRANTMDSNTSAPSPTQFYASQSNSGSNAYLSSVHSSQSSLVGLQQEYESASESELTDDNLSRSNSQTPLNALQVSLDGVQTPSAIPNTVQQLSGLVCNVHRTTGREPHPLVGATTTILGDKLYVFGGRRLSRSKPQLTSNLYELDLLHRHWTKIDATGDIPPPRYFHSVCPLGDTKLVCYGGMSPSPAPEPGNEAQPEVIVMSDIHIYNTKTKEWTKISTTESPQGRYAHCASILPSSAIFASATAPTSALQHNPQGDNANSGSLGISIDGTGGAEMVVVGGQDSSNHYIEEISVFNLRSLKWTSTASMGRSCGAYRSVVTPLTTMSATQIGAGPHARSELEEDDDEEPETIGSGSPLLIYSNYNFLDVKLELQIRGLDGNLTEKPMQSTVSPPGLRFPNGGIIDNHFVVSGTFLTSSKQEYALWALDLRTLTWSRIDAGGSIFSQGSWNRGVLWQRRNAFVILGNRKRSLVDDYNNRRINFSNICLVELEAFGLYNNPRRVSPSSGFLSASSAAVQTDITASGRDIGQSAEALGSRSLDVRELADMDFLAVDGSRIPVNSRVVARRWGPYFTRLLRESLFSGTDTDTMTLRPNAAGHPSRNSSITITQAIEGGNPSAYQGAVSDLPDTRSAPPPARPRLFYLPHTAPTIHALVHYLYTSSLPAGNHPLANTQIFCSLLQLARPYRIDGLLEAVIERLHESLDGRNAAAIFNAAAMGAGGGDGVQFTNGQAGSRDSVIPLRTASLVNMDAGGVNGAGRSGASLRIDTDMANGRSTRNTLRPGESFPTSGDDTDEETPQSATTDTSMSESEASLSSVTGRDRRDLELWTGATSAVVGLQKRGLRGLMEGRRMRERGRGGDSVGSRVGLGIV